VGIFMGKFMDNGVFNPTKFLTAMVLFSNGDPSEKAELLAIIY
jgi:hypothetical protein